MRSASQPEAIPLTERSHRVTVNTTVTAISGTPNSREIGTMISKKQGEIEPVENPA